MGVFAAANCQGKMESKMAISGTMEASRARRFNDMLQTLRTSRPNGHEEMDFGYNLS
jgi:hypothetical protein